MWSKCFLGLLLIGVMSCSSSSGGDDDGPTGPVIDSFSAPTTASLQNTDVGQGWPIPMIISFHDDTENVTGIDFSAQGGENLPVTFAPADQVKQASNFQTGIVLLYTPGNGATFKPGTTVDYAVSLLGASGTYGTAATGTVTLQ